MEAIVTERRPGEERKRGQTVLGAGASQERAPEEDAVLGLQELAGNRAVADLLTGAREATPAPSAGFRVRDLLRAIRQPVPSLVQRQPSAGWDKGGWGDKAAVDEKAAGADEKASGGDGAHADGDAASGEKDAWKDKVAWKEKAATPAGSSPMLATGSAGPAVVRLQGLLVSAGFAVTPDGAFGPGTRAAVVAFQASRGLAPDGIVGPMTWSELEAPGSSPAKEAPGGLVAPGEMELVGPGWEMEKERGGAGEATLPGVDALTKEGKLPGPGTEDVKEWD
jgi:murein L,D-transpeptidase YcbB/YkuD